MAIVCPQCTMPALPSAEIVNPAGRMLRCRRCGTTWLARPAQADQFAGVRGPDPQVSVRRTGRPRFERVIEHDPPAHSWRTPAPAVRPAERHVMDAPPPTDGRFVIGRRMLASWRGVVAAVFAIALVTMLAIQLSAVDASPGANQAQFAGLEIRLVRAAVEPTRNGREVVVIGEIANRSDDEIAVPAVRIALMAEGVERRFWHHEPDESELAPGGTTRFRSTLTGPPADVDTVAFRLAERQSVVLGMR